MSAALLTFCIIAAFGAGMLATLGLQALEAALKGRRR